MADNGSVSVPRWLIGGIITVLGTVIVGSATAILNLWAEMALVEERVEQAQAGLLRRQELHDRLRDQVDDQYREFLDLFETRITSVNLTFLEMLREMDRDIDNLRESIFGSPDLE